MQYEAPKAVELTQDEAELYETIKNEYADAQGSDWHEIADSMEELTNSLLAREAVPEIRRRLFADPDFAEVGKKSRHQVFESHGTSGNDILRHPDFVKYLKHFIEGPDLPSDVIDGLCKILNDDQGTSGMVMKQWQAHARASVRKHVLDKHKAGTEFFRLAVEIGMDVDDARMLRDAARSTR